MNSHLLFSEESLSLVQNLPEKCVCTRFHHRDLHGSALHIPATSDIDMPLHLLQLHFHDG